MNRILIIFIVILSALPLKAQWSILREDADSLLLVGKEYIYNVKFDSAQRCFNQIIRRYPNHPGGYFLSAMIDWWKIRMYRETERFDKRFLFKISKVIEKCNAILDTNDMDLTGLFFKGGALGYRGRFNAMRKNYFSAAGDGKEGFDILRTCYEVAPGNHDIMLGTGIFNYFVEAIPEQYPLLKPLTIFLPSGDKAIGILQLQAASRHARYTSTEALDVLREIYYQFEKDYHKALPILEQLHSSYPNNPYFHRYLGRCYVTTGKTAQWDSTWRVILNQCMDKKLGYDRVMAREACYYIGLAAYYRHNNDIAITYMKKAIQGSDKIDEEDTGFNTKAHLYLGRVYERMQNWAMARKYYEMVLDMDDYKDSHDDAEKYLDRIEKKLKK